MTCSAIRSIDFAREKYGEPLLADAAEVEALPGFIQTSEAHALTFYELMFVTGGHGALTIDDEVLDVRPRAAFVTRPGQVRSWRLRAPLRAVVLFFEREFIDGFFADASFTALLSPDAIDDGAGLTLAEPHFDGCLATLAPMVEEIGRVRADTPHFLRASLYQLLVLLNRHAERRAPEGPSASGSLEREFVALVEARFHEEQRVGAYARMLGVTPEHLSRTVRRGRGIAASEVIHRRVLLEAKRRLVYSDESAGSISDALGFSDPSYFNRFFKRALGTTPQRFRARARSSRA